MAEIEPVSAAGVSRFLGRCGFRRGSDFAATQVFRGGRSVVLVACSDYEQVQKFLEGRGYITDLHRSTGELTVLGRRGSGTTRRR